MVAAASTGRLTLIQGHQAELKACRRCPQMSGPVVVGAPVKSEILLIGQAPGDKEPALGRPFAWTAGKTLFKWFASIGVDEAQFRASVYMAAVCRCFPGKAPRGGDRVPSDEEVAACAPWLEREIELLSPRLLVPVGRLAIERFLPARPLIEQIGRVHAYRFKRREIAVLPLPHPSGASTWFRTEPGVTLLAKALAILAAHPSWKKVRTRA
jgi:uracil-DNA glycosylase